MQQNYGGGLGALGPVQSMSDRNDAQMMMVNRGQMFAGGGITALAKGGLPKYKYNPVTGVTELVEDTATSTTKTDDLLPKYKYDPTTQQYTLDESKKEDAAGVEALRPSEGSSTEVPSTSDWGQRTPAERAAYYADRPVEGMLARGAQNLLGYTGIGALSQYTNPDGWHSSLAEKMGFDPSQTSFGRGKGSLFGGLLGSAMEATPKAGVNAYGFAPVGMNTNYLGSLNLDPNAPSTFNPGASVYSGGNFGDSIADNTDSAGRTGGYSPAGGGEAPSTSSEAAGGVGGDYGGADTGDGWARGGIASLAYGGQSHLGDYSDGGRLLRGPGDGVSDSIPASIGGKRPARLADGEFVVPARIVSELGNGSTEAGARKLYAMMDRIQKARSKTVGKDRVAVNSRAEKNLPA
jgi:hypothetical protein